MLAGASNHDGGRVKFGPDGKLYWTVGDAQTTRYAQNVKSLNGKDSPAQLRRNHSAGQSIFQTPMFTHLAIGIPQGLAWQPEHADDCMPPNMDRAVSKAAAATK